MHPVIISTAKQFERFGADIADMKSAVIGWLGHAIEVMDILHTFLMREDAARVAQLRSEITMSADFAHANVSARVRAQVDAAEV